jgi:predicted O-methyltransferase YrrM
MDKRIQKILREQEKLNREGQFATISRETGEILHLLVKLKNPKNVLEVGTSIGYSAIWIASALKKGSLTCIDHWPERIHIAKSFFNRAKLPIKLIEGNALDVIPGLKTKFDMVFLDATKSEYLNYLKKVRLNKGALVIADNTISHASKMQDFLDYVGRRGAITLPIGSGITVLQL